MGTPLTKEDLKIGMRVKCIFKGCNFGRIGRIGSIKDIENSIWHIVIEWDDGSSRDIYWGCPSSFEAYENPIAANKLPGRIPLPSETKLNSDDSWTNEIKNPPASKFDFDTYYGLKKRK